MQAFCDKIYNWCNEIVSFQAGDNGMRVNQPRLEHTVAFLGETDLEELPVPAVHVKGSEYDTPISTVEDGAPKLANGKRAKLARFLKG